MKGRDVPSETAGLRLRIGMWTAAGMLLGAVVVTVVLWWQAPPEGGPVFDPAPAAASAGTPAPVVLPDIPHFPGATGERREARGGAHPSARYQFTAEDAPDFIRTFYRDEFVRLGFAADGTPSPREARFRKAGVRATLSCTREEGRSRASVVLEGRP